MTSVANPSHEAKAVSHVALKSERAKIAVAYPPKRSCQESALDAANSIIALLKNIRNHL